MTYEFEDDTYPLEAISRTDTRPLPAFMRKRRFPWGWFLVLVMLATLLVLALASGWIRVG